MEGAYCGKHAGDGEEADVNPHGGDLREIGCAATRHL